MTNSLLPSFEWNSIPMQQGQRRNSNSNPRRLSHLVPFVCLLSADVAAVVAVAAAAASRHSSNTCLARLPLSPLLMLLLQLLPLYLDAFQVPIVRPPRTFFLFFLRDKLIAYLI